MGERWKARGLRGWDGHWHFSRWRRAEPRHVIRRAQIRLIAGIVLLGAIDALTGGAVRRFLVSL